jgi:hypothetical protein
MMPVEGQQGGMYVQRGSSARTRRHPAIADHPRHWRRRVGQCPASGQIGSGVGQQQLADTLVRDVPLGAIAVQHGTALHAQPRLQAARGVVQPGVDHLAVAAAAMLANLAFRLANQHLAPGHGQLAGNRQAHHARAYHHAIHLLHYSRPASCSAASQPSR